MGVAAKLDDRPEDCFESGRRRMNDRVAFLGVERSVTGRRWVGPSDAETRKAQQIAQATGVPDLVAEVLARRGVDEGEVGAFLTPTLRDLMLDPSGLRDMDRAADRFVEALSRGERIAVFADYDVDGAASAALILNWLRELDRDATLYVPDRIDEGFGPNVPAMRRLGADHDLIVCVDCGTMAHEPIAAAGTDVIVLDHHQGGESLPPALAVVNPNRQDESRDLGYLCAAGVVFLFLVALNRLRRARREPSPELLDLLDLVGLATVADVAPLVGLNRAFVRQGLSVLAKSPRPGLASLQSVSGLSGPPTAYSLGFVLGPRINAGGRVGQSQLGARLLATRDVHEADAIAGRLDDLNRQRKEIEAGVQAEAEAQIAQRSLDAPLVWAAAEGWHPGVVGIVAARLKEKYRAPALVIGVNNGIGTGSGRSIAGVDLGSAITRLALEGLIARGGGHAMAAGITLAEGQLGPAMDRLSELLSGGRRDPDAGPEMRVDGIIGTAGATRETVLALEAAGPFGAGAPAPRVVVSSARLRHVRPVGDGHVALSLSDASGVSLDAVAFRANTTSLGQWLMANRGRVLHAAGRLELDRWQGRERVKLHLEDASPVKQRSSSA